MGTEAACLTTPGGAAREAEGGPEDHGPAARPRDLAMEGLVNLLARVTKR
jgi:hypothetical protein